ncbi:hypothetical protein EPA93_44030 [Ktedonosporobacter rubrisoli]|uniref:Uncharacterized protein n=1 Tax=Ktedonosporobacter rubrisoli TaxID=2509675 RepID=A0A4V0Z0A8_KTERU|nr:hypothetical protein [Ktedonosporobacter rubrisoli]QBD82571.1 hypothetical protein EPA93_44030 [Ktedonosporobacter rubrisoli]
MSTRNSFSERGTSFGTYEKVNFLFLGNLMTPFWIGLVIGLGKLLAPMVKSPFGNIQILDN